jgi:hypothetical protein
MNRTRTSLAVLGILLGAILTGCGDSGGGGGDETPPPTEGLTDEQAKAVAMESLASVINKVATAIDTVNDTVVTSRSMTVVAKTGVGNVPLSEPIKQVLVDRTRSAVTSARQRASARRVALHEGHDDGVVDADELAEYLVFKSRDGNAITYTLNPAVACDADDTTCLDRLERITLVQTIETDDSGTIDVRADDHNVVTIGYAANAIYLQIDLAELKTIAETEGETGFETVTAFEGQLRLTLTILNDTEGAEKVSIGFGNPKAIKVAGTDDGQNISLDVAASDTVLALIADAGADTAAIELGLGTVHLLYSDAGIPNILHFGALTGVFTFSADKLVATGVGVGGEAYLDEGADGTKDDRVTMSNLDFTSDGTTELITFNSALDVKEESLDPAASLATTATAGTALESYEAWETPYDYYYVWKVAAGGPFAMNGSGTLDGSLSVTAGSCFRENPVSDVFPIVLAGCPILID